MVLPFSGTPYPGSSGGHRGHRGVLLGGDFPPSACLPWDPACQMAPWHPSGLFHAAGKNVVVKADKWSVKIGLIPFWSSGNEDLVADQMSDL